MEKQFRIIGVILVGIIIIFEQVLQLDSFVKQAFKIVLLVLIPLALIYYYKKSTFRKEYHFDNVTKLSLKKPLIIGVVLYFLTLFGYWLFQPIIDPDLIVEGLQENGIFKTNIVWAAIYLSFVNSFLEEFFFRGFLYHPFVKIKPWLGYLVPSLLFSIYHVLVMFTIFNLAMGFLALFGLTLVGMLLVYVNQSNKSIINSWIVHIFADLGVVTIGLYLFFIA